ncbi:LxmA leader domain family RiPP [Kitasatospora sp. NPDC101155]|uniref:LxmA leader domain family RiPP n=1 Tax=Kitasatospora sp. NPDC101155 TaxID=3364097 RepID=UPI003819730F
MDIRDTTEELIAGYAAYTDAEEFGASASDDAPATTPACTVTITVVETNLWGC